MRQTKIAAALFGIGAACFAITFVAYTRQKELYVDRPEATGDVGFLTVYAQLPTGPVPLQPGRKRTLPRPQDFAFQWTVNGTGPRLIRIEVEGPKRHAVMHEEHVSSPADRESLGYVLTLGEESPDDVTIIVAIEAPHTVGYESRFPIHLVGSSSRE